MSLIKNTIKQFRSLAFFEGASLILLVFVTTPLKYMYDQPIGTKILGPIHGILFIAYVFYTFVLKDKYNWSWQRTAWLLLASIVPFGTFISDAKILKKLDDQEETVH